MEQITWQVVVIIVGGITAFLTFMYNMLASRKPADTSDPWKNSVDRNEAIVKEQITHIKKELENLRDQIEDNDERTRETLAKFEAKLERFTEIIIEHLKK